MVYGRFPERRFPEWRCHKMSRRRGRRNDRPLRRREQSVAGPARGAICGSRRRDAVLVVVAWRPASSSPMHGDIRSRARGRGSGRIPASTRQPCAGPATDRQQWRRLEWSVVSSFSRNSGIAVPANIFSRK